MIEKAGAFQWVRSMGVHEAYHLSRANRIIHWTCIPLELFCAVKLLSLAAYGRVDLALAGIVVEKGVDDTEKNVAEFKGTKNPVPLVLIFYYHLVEVLFALRYRPALRRTMESHKRDELARIADDPRFRRR